MTSIHRIAFLKAAIAVGAIRVATSAIGAAPTTPSTGTLIPMRPARSGPESAGRTPYGSRRARAA
ncbi:hypothetical protein PV721_24390 [Streptomyces sp. MB09-01]|uniref:hypothetical protein n=1 Tax=Streptomyces sp. MB09-01 TaxID=3028666 RepID=UPI0029A82AA0|nr:hypothetical protein [Streptomyces sp. MB09-01]MDX3537452.1 hypothetical protein [Streptomyces sp. MB09-01]